jgi:hypothetical protein
VINLLRVLILVVGVVSVIADCSSAQAISTEKKADIQRLMDMTGGLKIGKMMSQALVGEMSKSIKALRPDISEAALSATTEEVNALISESLPSFAEICVGIYDKHFTAEEIRLLITFYSSDIGKKVIEVMPTIAQESVKAGQEWGESLGPEVQRRVEARLKKEDTRPRIEAPN